MKKSQIARIVELDEQIRSGFYPNRVRFAVEYEVSERTVARDIEYIRYQLGAPLEYCARKRGFFYKEAWKLPQVIQLSAERAQGVESVIELVAALTHDEQRAVIAAIQGLITHSKISNLGDGRVAA